MLVSETVGFYLDVTELISRCVFDAPVREYKTVSLSVLRFRSLSARACIHREHHYPGC